MDGCLHFWGLHIGIKWYARMPFTSNGSYNQESADEPLNLGYLVLQKNINIMEHLRIHTYIYIFIHIELDIVYITIILFIYTYIYIYVCV